MNTTGIYPIDYKVLIEQEKVEETSAGGIVLVKDHVEKQQWKVWKCKVIDLGPKAFSDHPESRKPRIDDWIVIREYAGYRLQGTDGNEYHLINDKDVLSLYGADHE